MATMPTTLPTGPEIGHPGGHVRTWSMVAGDGYEATSYEDTPELQFPHSVVVYDHMRKDGQIAALLRAIGLPLLSNTWTLAGDDVRPEVRDFVASELGLGADDDGPTRRRRHGIVWRDHLRDALLSLPFGFVPFERSYTVGPPNRDQIAPFGGDVVHLGRLAIRHPRTIEEIRVTRGGDLAGVVQSPLGAEAVTGRERATRPSRAAATDDDGLPKLITADRLVMYSLDREGADWSGTSILRGAYKHWLIKDHLLRLGGQTVERNGMGLPVVYYDPDKTTRAEALALATSVRAGAHAGVAVPDQIMRLELLGVKGQIKDELPLVKYHDQAMSRTALAMFLDLGHDNGARALGDTFVDYFVMSLQAFNDWLGDVATEDVIADLVRLNFGADEPYPLLVADEITAEAAPTAEALKALADAGIVIPDDDLEANVRRRYKLPAAGVPRPPADAPPGVPGAEVDVPVVDLDNTDPDEVDDPAGDVDDDVAGHLAAADAIVDRIEALRAARR